MEATTPGDAAAPEQLDDEALRAKVQETLEGLLAKKNLVRDQFLAGNMNPQMYIPIRVLLAHEKMRAIGATEEFVAAAAAKSTKLGLDDARTMVRPLLKSKRNVVILRDIPDDTTEEEVRNLFVGGPFGEKIASVKADVNNTWFVKFNLDEGTQDAVLWLRLQQFKGRPVNAAIKSEHFLRSFYPVHGPADMPMPVYDAPPQMYDTGPPMGYPMDGNPMFQMGGMPGGPPPEGMGGCMGPMGFEFGDPMMEKGGKGMMPMPMPEMPMMGPPGPQPPGSWKPWGARHQPPPMILPNITPEKTPGDPEKKTWEKQTWEKSESSWKGGGWQKNSWKGGGWDGGNAGKGKGKSSEEKGAKGKGKSSGWSKGSDKWAAS